MALNVHSIIYNLYEQWSDNLWTIKYIVLIFIEAINRFKSSYNVIMEKNKQWSHVFNTKNTKF